MPKSEAATDEQIEAILKRESELEPGPWSIEDVFADEFEINSPESHICMVYGRLDHKLAVAVASFIANSRKDIPSLIARIEAEQEARREVEKENELLRLVGRSSHKEVESVAELLEKIKGGFKREKETDQQHDKLKARCQQLEQACEAIEQVAKSGIQPDGDHIGLSTSLWLDDWMKEYAAALAASEEAEASDAESR